MGELNFLDYDKISDTLMYFDQNVSLRFCVGLNYKNKLGENVSFHAEYTTSTGRYIRRNIHAYFIINDNRDYKNSIMILPKDVAMLQMLMNNAIIPWMVGNKRIYSENDNHELIIKGKWSLAEFPLSEYRYMTFAPIIVSYQDGTFKEGIRMTMNSKDSYVDMDINKFMEFYYYICNTDMYSAAVALLNYVKQSPYGMNTLMYGSTNDTYYQDDNNRLPDKGGRNKFFDSI